MVGEYTQQLAEGVETQVEAHLLRERVREAVFQFPPRTAWVLRKRFGLDAGEGGGEWTLAAVGKSLGVQKERIRQIEAKALRQLRHPSRSRDLRRLYDLDYGRESLDEWRAGYARCSGCGGKGGRPERKAPNQ